MTQAPINALRVFEAIARLGSFRAAADALCVTQSAVSHQVRNLEEWLGRPLFERVGNRTQILPQGRELAASLGLAFSDIDAACQRIKGSASPLVIAAIPSVAMCWLIPRLSRFRAAHPECDLRIVYAMHGQEINFHEVDLAFVFDRSGAGQFFLGGHSAPVCSPLLLQGLGRAPRDDGEIAALGLLHDTGHDGWQAWFQGGDAPHAAAESGPIFEDFNLLRIAALSGQGAALCPLAMVQPDLLNGSLVQLSSRVIHSGYDYYLRAAPQSGQVKPSAARFWDWAMSERDRSLAGR